MINFKTKSQKTSQDISHWMPLAIFAVAVIGTTLWTRIPQPIAEAPKSLRTSSELTGFRFHQVPLGKTVYEILATTNLLNGHFFDSSSNRYSVFHAVWEPGSISASNAFGHPPELCWVGAGFERLSLGQPSQTNLAISGQNIPFQCRVLRHPALGTPELVLWTACMGGDWYGFDLGSNIETSHEKAGINAYLKKYRRRFLNQFTIINRMGLNVSSLNARKQFIRLSQPVTIDWQTSLASLEGFAQRWLDIKSQK
jgi:hypothetical protein